MKNNLPESDFSLTPEQVDSIAAIRQTWRNVERVNLKNDTPNGLRVDIIIGGKSPEVQSYRMGTTENDYHWIGQFEA